MSFSKIPNVSKKQINKAGKKLADSENYANEVSSIDLVNGWRAAHAYPINTFRATLEKNTKKFKGSPIVAQRLKRMPTIIDKLKRHPTTQITTMQDIGGLRAIMEDVEDVYALANQYKTKSRFKHELKKENDYINNPRPEDGYRSLHLIYKYKNDQAPAYEGLLLEVQIRTKLQHTWATAVETTDILLNEALKSKRGDAEWQRFFALVSSAFAYIEKTTPVFSNFDYNQTIDEIRGLTKKLNVFNRLTSISLAADNIDNTKWSYHLVVLNTDARSVSVTSYSREQAEKASKDYILYERRAASGEKIEPVLVSAGKIDELKKAYPNFFLDTQTFLSELKSLLN